MKKRTHTENMAMYQNIARSLLRRTGSQPVLSASYHEKVSYFNSCNCFNCIGLFLIELFVDFLSVHKFLVKWVM